MNFLCTVGNKAPLECDVKSAGFEEQVEHRSSSGSVAAPPQSTRQCHPEPLSDSLSFREHLTSKFMRPQICQPNRICVCNCKVTYSSSISQPLSMYSALSAGFPPVTWCKLVKTQACLKLNGLQTKENDRIPWN